VSQLAIYGGKKLIPDGAIKNWPPIDDIDRKYVMASLESPTHSYGPNCVKLQEEFAAWNGNKFAITTNSGTAALHMAVAAVGLGAGDHVLVTAYSWSSSATCALHHDAIPVFVDIDYDTMNMDPRPRKLEEAITPQTKAIIVVHLHGLAVDMDAVMQVARKHKLKVVEDCCQSHGALFNGRKVGTFGDCAAFSLNQNKTLCGGEGGIFVTDNAELHQRAMQVWSFGETRSPIQDRDYHAYALGWMYRNSDLNAAFARAQLSKLDRYIEVQRENTAVMLEELRGLPGVLLPTEPKGFLHNWYNVNLRIVPEHFGLEPAPFVDGDAGNKAVAAFREKLVAALQAEGVRVGMWQRFILPAMTVFQAKNAYGHGAPWSLPWTGPVEYSVRKFPVAQAHTDRHICLAMPQRAPNGAEAARLTAAGVRKVFDNVGELLTGKEGA